MPVPLLDVNAQNHPLEGEFQSAFTAVLKHGRFIMGPEITELEERVAALSGCGHGVAVASGTDALLMSLMAMGIGPGDEVLCPAFTFFATAGAVHRVGATPVFVDSCPVCFNIDAGDAEAKITARTRAIIPVHLFGQSADMTAIMSLAEKHGLRVIEDAAQAIGAAHHGRPVCSFGDCGTLSFFPSKNLGGLGDSGMVVTRDEGLARRLRVLRNHGMEPKYHHQVVGGNFRMDTFQAAFLLAKLERLEAYNRARAENAAVYLRELGKLPGVVAADPAHCRCPGGQRRHLEETGARIVLPAAYDHNICIWNQFTIRVLNGRRDDLLRWLQERQIGCEIYYPVTLDRQECFQHLPESSRAGCETARMLAEEVLSIPVYPELGAARQAAVIEAFADYLNAG
jgi:dTDP-4-amino-4,6-dideoxygalactose transaminase